MRFLSRLAAAAAAVLLASSVSSAVAQGFTFPLVNQTGLDSSQYTLYAMGFSYNSGLVMTSNGTFVSQTTGTVSSYPVGSGGVTSIAIANGTAFQGGRLYFFVVPTGDPAPSVTYGTQPANPPATGVPPYAIVEITTPASGAGTVDVQTVDGFSFPITITMSGQTNVAGKQYGQPLNTPTVNRAAIFDAYNSFITNEGTDATPYADLVYGAGTVAGQPGGILNPYAYLCAVNTQNQFVNLGSSLRTVWDTDLGTLFAATGLRVQGSASGAADSPTIVTQSYTVTPVTQTYPDTTVSLPALKFVGETNSSNVFYVFSPIGLSYLTNDSGTAITGSIANQNTSGSGNTLTTLTLNAPVTGLTTGMYVIGAGLATTTDSSSRGIAVSTITAINGQVLTLDPPLQGAPPTANSQYQFCKVPYLTMFTTTGQMVFGNTGVFADNSVQYPGANNGNSTVLGSLENSLVSALNRGVGVNATALNPGTAGGSTTVW
ncbi:MAG TPA: hypothetical protein VNB29_11565, partial [Chthoniobacterales bacterium]|nr:hypothetical protein [Chthoniobacterales bacterium]